jgi:hypothetical protein
VTACSATSGQSATRGRLVIRFDLINVDSKAVSSIDLALEGRDQAVDVCEFLEESTGSCSLQANLAGAA